MPTGPASPAVPGAGALLLLDRAASPQFAVPIRVRVIRQQPWTTYDGWCWLDCYQLNAAGDAIARRNLFVQAAGVRYLTDPPRRPTGTRRPTTAARRPARTPARTAEPG